MNRPEPGQADLRVDGLVTLPALMQRVQTFMRLVVVPTWTRIRWMFGFQRRFVRRCEWLKLMPKIGFLSHTSQTLAMGSASLADAAAGRCTPAGIGRRPDSLDSQRCRDRRASIVAPAPTAQASSSARVVPTAAAGGR